MLLYIRHYFQVHKSLLSRVMILGVIGIAILVYGEWLEALALPVGWMFLMSAMSLLMRRVLAPYLDAKEAWKACLITGKIGPVAYMAVLYFFLAVLCVCSTALLVVPYLHGAQ